MQDFKDVANTVLAFAKENSLSPQECIDMIEDIQKFVLARVIEDKHRYVIKKNRVLEEFDIEKLMNSIAAAAKDAGQSIPQADINRVVLTAMEAYKKDKIITVKNLRHAVQQSLTREGLSEVRKKYLEG